MGLIPNTLKTFQPSQIYFLDDKHTVVTNSKATRYMHADHFKIPDHWTVLSLSEEIDIKHMKTTTLYLLWTTEPKMVWLDINDSRVHKDTTIHDIKDK